MGVCPCPVYVIMRMVASPEWAGMHNANCSKCGHDPSHGSCSSCGHAPVNGAHRDPPPEVASLVIDRPSPEMLEEARQTFDETEYLVGVREIKAGGGHRIEDFIGEIERLANGKQ
jgi:hypothetical protein